jgi:hypothetical protein
VSPAPPAAAPDAEKEWVAPWSRVSRGRGLGLERGTELGVRGNPWRGMGRDGAGGCDVKGDCSRWGCNGFDLIEAGRARRERSFVINRYPDL